MYKLFMYFFFISLLNVVFSSYANVDIKSLPYCSSNTKENLDKIVYVSTLDGKITALNANENGSILWEFKTGDKEMLSSTIQNRELTNSGSWVRMIPSLSGSLYKFDGENIDLVPVTADELLTSSFKYSDDLVFSGGKEMLTYGVGLRNGQLIYKCDIHGCHNETNLDKSIDKDDILIIQKKQQTVHAISPDNGSERWNFSVAQHEIKAVKSTECHANEKFNLDLIIKVVLPEGLIFAVSETNMNHVIWTQKLNSPITNAWKWINNELKPVDIFTGTQWSWNKAPTFNSPSIYVGMHKKQLYIQESAIMQSIASDYVINFKQNYVQNKLPPKIPWKPFPVSSSLVTALMPNYDEGESTEETTDIVSEIGTTSLAVLYASKYINGHGFYLYIDSDLKENEEISCDKLNTSESPPPSSEESDFFFDDETPVQIIIVSLWFWWKEVVVISVTTAFVVNFILARRFLNSSQIQEGVQQEIIFIERHVQIPFDENADKKEMIRHSSESSNSGVDISNGNDLPFNSRFLTDFDVIHCLGKGGFGMVFEARNKIDEWNYAVKQINLPNRLDSRQRVMREVKALAKLDHRNIVRYYNAWLEFPPADWQSNVMSCILDISHSTYESPTEDSISIAEAPGENYNKIDIYDDGDEDDSFIVFGDNSNDSNSKSVSKHRNTSKYSDSNSKNNQIVPKNSTNIIEIVNKSDSSQNNAATTRSTLNVERRMYLYIQMQLCQKESLKDWMLKNVVRDPHSIKVIFEQILSAVEYVHLQGLIHRDLKPSNIFFSLDGEIKIGDFGLVTAMDDDEYVSSDTNTLTKTKFKKHTREVGTQLYMSPEQVKGSFYNYKVDIYSLGVIFFELLTPFSTEMERHKTLSELRLNKFPDSFHQKFQYEHDLLKLMLATKPEKRPTTYGIRSRPPFNHTIDNTKWHFELPPRQGTVK